MSPPVETLAILEGMWEGTWRGTSIEAAEPPSAKADGKVETEAPMADTLEAKGTVESFAQAGATAE